MKILFVWTGITPFAGDCWRALQALPNVELKLVIDVQKVLAHEREILHDLDYELIADLDFHCPGSKLQNWGWRPDVLFAVGWHSRVVRAFVERKDWKDVPKVQCCDMPWRWKFRCFAARFILWRYLRRFAAVYVPGRLGVKYMKWLGFKRIYKGLLAIDMNRFSVEMKGEAERRKGFVYVGRISSEKRIDLIEKAFARYRELSGQWTVDYCHSTPYSQLPQVYAAHACLLLASEHDAWPLVILESKAAGLEVIASDRCGNAAELGARRVPFGDVEAMAREMLTVEREWSEGRVRPQVGLANPYAASYDCKAWAKRTLEIARRTCRIRGFCPGMDDPANGMAVVARLLARDEAFRGDFIVHGMWLPRGWWACLRHFGNYVRMTHGSLSPLYLEHQGKWKKRLVRPIERFFLRHARKVLATCEAEAEWIRAYVRGNREQGTGIRVEAVDLKRFFKLEGFGDQTKAPPRGTLREYAVSPRSDFRSDRLRTRAATLHILYLGRRHPLKGVEYLEKAVSELKKEHPLSISTFDLDLRIVSNHSGAELESDWDWCDVLVLPTLSENFGIVVAEALERGKRVVTTDGAPAWEGQPGVVYLKGYREGTDVERVELLKRGLMFDGILGGKYHNL